MCKEKAITKALIFIWFTICAILYCCGIVNSVQITPDRSLNGALRLFDLITMLVAIFILIPLQLCIIHYTHFCEMKKSNIIFKILTIHTSIVVIIMMLILIFIGIE